MNANLVEEGASETVERILEVAWWTGRHPIINETLTGATLFNA